MAPPAIIDALTRIQWGFEHRPPGFGLERA